MTWMRSKQLQRWSLKHAPGDEAMKPRDICSSHAIARRSRWCARGVRGAAGTRTRSVLDWHEASESHHCRVLFGKHSCAAQLVVR